MRTRFAVALALGLFSLTSHAEQNVAPAPPPVPALPPVSPPITPVPALPNLTLGGHFRYRVEGDEFQDFTNLRSFSSLRVRPTFGYQLDDKTKIVFEPQFAKIFGERPFLGSTATTNAPQTTSGATYDTAVGFHQGFLEYKPNSTLTFTLGRQILSYGEEILVGAADWGPIGRVFDAFKTRVSYGPGNTDFFAAKLIDTNPVANGPGDSNFYGIYNSYNFGHALRSADLYFLFLRNGAIQPRQDVRALGVRFKSGFEDFSAEEEGFKSFLRHIDYRVEATYENGSGAGNGAGAYMVDAEAGYTLSGDHKLRFAVNAEVASRNFNQLFAAPHRWYGFADLFGRRNIDGYSARVSGKIVGELTAQMELYTFSRNSTLSPAYRTDGVSPLGGKSPSGSTRLGEELDLTLRYKHTKVISFSGGASLVKPGEYLRGEFGSRHPKFYFLSVEAKL